jgi:hypothetical protein
MVNSEFTTRCLIRALSRLHAVSEWHNSLPKALTATREKLTLSRLSEHFSASRQPEREEKSEMSSGQSSAREPEPSVPLTNLWRTVPVLPMLPLANPQLTRLEVAYEMDPRHEIFAEMTKKAGGARRCGDHG